MDTRLEAIAGAPATTARTPTLIASQVSGDRTVVFSGLYVQSAGEQYPVFGLGASVIIYPNGLIAPRQAKLHHGASPLHPGDLLMLSTTDPAITGIGSNPVTGAGVFLGRFSASIYPRHLTDSEALAVARHLAAHDLD